MTSLPARKSIDRPGVVAEGMFADLVLLIRQIIDWPLMKTCRPAIGIIGKGDGELDYSQILKISARAGRC